MFKITNMKQLNAIAENFPHKRLFINKNGDLGVVTSGAIVNNGEVSTKEHVDFYNLKTMDTNNIELVSHIDLSSSDVAKQECFMIRKHHMTAFSSNNGLIPAFVLSPINIYSGDVKYRKEGVDVNKIWPVSASSTSVEDYDGKDYYCIKSKDSSMIFNNICVPRIIDSSDVDEMKNNLLFMMATCNREEPVWSGMSIIKYYDEEAEEVIDLNAVWDNNIFLIEDRKHDDDITAYCCYSMKHIKYFFSHVYERIREINNLLSAKGIFDKVQQ